MRATVCNRAAALRHRWAFLLLSVVLATAAWAGTGLTPWQSPGATAFLPPEEVFVPGAPRREGTRWVVEGRIADAHYLYRHALALVDGDGASVALQSPAGTPRTDEFFGDTEVYEGDSLRLSFPSDVEGPLQLKWQGCAEAGICYPPQSVALTLPVAGSARDTAQESDAVAAATRPTVPDRDSARADVGAYPAAVTALPTASTDRSGDADREPGIPSGDGEPRARAAAPPATTPALPAAARPAQPPASTALAEDQHAADRLAALGPVAGMLLFFGFGLLLAFTPCTLPMVPIVSGLVVGSNATPRRAVALSAAYVLAMATTYAGVGVAAGLAGANLQAALQSPWLLGLFAALFLLLAASLFGAFELRLPNAVANRLATAGQGRAGGSLMGAAMLGLLSALLVGPCMTAPLAGALLYIGQTGSALIGGLALFALGLGMGVPLVLIAVFGARVLPAPGPWMDRVRIVFGFVMVAMAILMLARFVPGTVGLMLWGAWLLAIAVTLLAWGRGGAVSGQRAVAVRFTGLLAGLWSTLMLVGAAAGGDSALHPLQGLGQARATAPSTAPAYVNAKSIADVDARIAEASEAGRWTLIDFCADWCVSCHVIEREVFGHPEVAARLAAMQVVRPDVTGNDATDQALLAHWQVLGPPTLVLVGPDGRERRVQRSVGEVDAAGFLARLDAAGVP